MSSLDALSDSCRVGQDVSLDLGNQDAWRAALADAVRVQLAGANAGHTTIEERFNPIGGDGSAQYYHAYVVVTDPAGRETYIRGGPAPDHDGPTGGSGGALGSASGGSSGRSSGSNASDSSNSSNGSSPGSGPGGHDDSNGPWGSLTTLYGPRAKAIDANPHAIRVVVAVQDGDQSRADIRKLERAADSVANEHLPYNPLTTNSNATAREVLERSGFTPKPPPVWAPGWDTRL